MVGYVERDAYCAAILLARMADAALDPAPLFCGDLADLDASPFAGVDLVSAGFPCQPVSLAGKGLVEEDDRWLWPRIERVLREVRPGVVFVENVAALALRGLDAVLGSLARLGFDAEWSCVSAAEIGAPHLRRRLFLLAYAERERLEGIVASGTEEAPALDDRDALGRAPGRTASQEIPDADGGRREGERVEERAGIEGEARRLSGGLRPDRELLWPGWPPEEDDLEGWERYLDAGGPEPVLRRGPDGPRSRVDRLRALGNAVVPQQAEYAFRVLATRILEGENL